MKNRMNESGFRRAVENYLKKNDLAYDEQLKSFPNIDCTLVCIGDIPVLIVSNDPKTGYIIEETEHTREFANSLAKASA